MNEIDGVKTERAIKTAVAGNFGDLQVPFLNCDQLIENKKACGRARDIADLEDLGAK